MRRNEEVPVAAVPHPELVEGDRGRPMSTTPATGAERGAVPAPVRAFRYDKGATGAVAMREIAEEIPVEIQFGGAPFAVMMASPLDLEDFAYGFALTEGAIASAKEIRAVDVELASASARVNVTLTAKAMSGHLARKRALLGRTGCGVCGVEDLTQFPKARRATPTPPLDPAAIGVAIAALEMAQPLNALTHAVHAAAWAGRDGAIQLVREDVGRHNALDKLIGALTRADADVEQGFLIITSRCSFEMVVKAATFGASTLVAISAPTTLALETARLSGVDLIAIARADGALTFDVYPAQSGAAA